MGELAPSVIAADFAHLADELDRVASFAQRWHVDVMDGHYVPNLTIGPMIVEAIASVSTLPQDVHLMITNPADTWEWYAKAGASRIAFHPETASDPLALLREMRSAGVAPGLAVNPELDADVVRPFLGDVDLLVVMSVHPGFSGQKFIPEAVPKLRRLREIAGRDLDLVIDGGVNESTAPPCVAAGANVLVSASAIFGADDPRAVAARLKAIVDAAP
jgi:ribulose-phosphate 3-epimerase